jgi:hypothetical protein
METNINILDASFEELNDMLGSLHNEHEKMFLDEIQKQQVQIRKSQHEIVKNIKLSVGQNIELKCILNTNSEYVNKASLISNVVRESQDFTLLDVCSDIFRDKILPIVLLIKSNYIIDNYSDFIQQAQILNDESNLKDLQILKKLESEYRNLARLKSITAFKASADNVEDALSSNASYIKLLNRIERLEKIICLVGRENNQWLNRSTTGKDSSTQTDFVLQNISKVQRVID